MFVAELDQNNLVVRVLAAESVQWCVDTFGGVWVETSDPFYWTEPPDLEDPEWVPPEIEMPVVTFAGVGYGCDPAIPERFILDQWTTEKATIPDPVTGVYFYNTQGMLTWYNNKGWRNLLPDGSPNVWEPGVANWREYPMGDEYPLWIQPSGAFDAYPVEFVVEHNGSVWISNTPANVWEPGAAGITQWDEVV